MNVGPRWLVQLKDLVREAVDQVPDQGRQSRRLAEVTTHRKLGPGWFVVRGRLTPAEAEAAGGGRLRDAQDRSTREYDVLEVVVSGEEVRIRTSVSAPRVGLELHVPAGDRRRILTGLADGLEAVSDAALLGDDARPKLTPILVGEDLTSAPGWPQLRPAQQRAVAACCAPGLQLVWGPPGTGKTHVLATALTHLIGAGHRVLLVSSSDLAVDTALQQAVRLKPPADGEAVRIGTVHLPALAADPRINLARLTEARHSELYRRASALTTRIQGLTRARDHLSRALAEIGDFDTVEYQRASRRVAHRSALERQRHDLGPAEADVAGARADQLRFSDLLLSLACREAAETEAAIRSRLASVETELATLTRRYWTRVRYARAIGRFRATRLELINDLARASSALSQAEQAARQLGVAPDACGRLSRNELETGRDSATGRLKAAQTRLADLRRELARLSALDLADPADQALVTDQWPIWQLHNTLPRLRAEAEAEHHERQPVEREYAALQEWIRRERPAIEQEIIAGAAVVATTLNQLALRPWITAEPFDHVLIDEAAAAQLPHLVHAVGRARIGAVLIGDPLQNTPLVDLESPVSEQVRAAFTMDCFTFFGTLDPAQAQTWPGCVVLTEQFDSGPALTELANRVGYGDLLRTAVPGTTGEIVVITVDGLPPAWRAIGRQGDPSSGRWAIGALLGRALAERHARSPGAGSPEPFGVLVASRSQDELSRKVLEDADRGLVPVGSAPVFQGRRFDTLLVDLVGGGGDPLAAARLLSVAATRPRHRLYLLLTEHALQQAERGPLAAVREMIGDGTAHRVNLAALLALSSRGAPVFDAPTPGSGSAEADLLAALGPYLRVAGPRPEVAAVAEVVEQIGRATASVWCWNAWTGRDAVAITDALEHAHRRGVVVHAICRPPDQVQLSNRQSLERLAERLPHVVFLRDLDQRIVVTDRRWSSVGSLNLVSPTRNPRQHDFMLRVHSPGLAEQLLSQELAEELARPRRCRQCDEPLRECRDVRREPNRRRVWLCANQHQTPFAESHSRNTLRR
jgi:hypothetical protein